MTVISKSCGLLQANMYVVFDDCRNAIVIDPISLPCLQEIVSEHSLSIRAIFMTHAHFDHTSDLEKIKKAYSVPSYIHVLEQDALNDPEKNVSFLIGKPQSLGCASHTLIHGDCITVSNLSISVHHTPGHSRGSCCYEINDALFTGDTLFASGIGRCDLYGGDFSLLLESLRYLSNLDKNFKVYPGHGPSSTLFYEKNFNPYLNFQ